MKRIDIPDLIRQLREVDETRRIEAKAASEIGKSILETVSAFSNEPGMGGGFLLLGVSRSKDSLFPDEYAVTGVEQPDKVISDLGTQCNSLFNVPLRPVIDQVEIGSKVVVAAYIPEAESDDKPVYIQSRGLPAGAFRRLGSSDVRCKDTDLATFYRAQSGRHFDDRLLTDTTLHDYSAAALNNYRRARKERDPNAPELAYGDEDLLRALRMVRNDAGGVPRFTVAGALLFGSRDLLRDYFPIARVDYIRVPGRTWIEDPHNRFTTLDVLDPIFESVYRIEAAILDDLPVAFSLPEGSLHREDKPLIPRDVIREALVNAVMHADYQANSPIQIIRYSNRIEFRNKGYSLKPEEELGQPGSELRNPKLAGVLHQTRLAEQKGSGIATMRNLMHQADLTPPTFTSDQASNKFVTTLLLHHFLSPDNLAWLSHFEALNLSREEKQALVFARETERLTNADYRNINGVDSPAASSALRHLRDNGLLQQHDRGAATFYTPSARLLRSETAADIPQEGADIPQVERDIPQAGAVIPQVRRDIPHPPPPEIPAEAWAEVPLHLQETVARLGGRVSHSRLRQLIVQLCHVRAWTAEELAHLTRRTRNHLLREHLTQLVEQGTLRHVRRSPQDRYQAYVAAENSTEV